MAIITELLEADSSSTKTCDYRYEVFLSFRGEDTRYNFTDHLHKALVDATIHTFLDDEEIQTGEDLKPELENAIKESRASIIVLSKNYASSTWCLDELVMILEQRRTSNHIVLPIFYHVEPSDVRKQQSSFGESLIKHKQNIAAETDLDKKSQRAHKMELWKKALTEVVDLKGKDANGRRETELIEEIVKEISSRLCLHLRSELPHLIGMQSSIEIITSWLKDGSMHNADILTIWGIAGIGKTSLAKYIHQLHNLKFERSSFLEDIERKCTQQSSRLIDFQKELLEDISNTSSIKVHDVDAYTYKIEKALLSKKVLLVLDDIDNFKQLDALLGKRGFHPGSKIIITTKQQSIVEKSSLFSMKVETKHTKHALKALDKTNSLRLFSWHAFKCDDPKEGYEEESRKVVEYCGGHPLALEVLGSSLRNQDMASWEDTLEELEKQVHPDIQKVLQISFDSLPSEKDKELFKHITCFFVGKDREFTEKILKACDICKSSGIKNLIDRCLLTIQSDNKLMMHPLLQDMGRNAVCQESPKKPWKRSLLWYHEECFNVLKERKGTTKLQGLVFNMKTFENETLHGSSTTAKQKLEDDIYGNFRSFPLLHRVRIIFSVIWWLFGWAFRLCSSFHQPKDGFETAAFSKMCNLRLLQLNYVQLNGSYKNFPKGLRWLCMHGFPLGCIPSDFQMENMVALDMSYSNLEQPWRNHKFLGSLKFLNLSYCYELVRVGDFFGLPILERLILAQCTSLIEVCESIGNCDKLVLLDVSGCIKLKKLPRSIGKLKKLRTLSIDGCANLAEFPIELKDMESLEVLNACTINIKSQASSMEAVPISVKSLAISLPSSLVELSLGNNNLFNESFPKDFSSLSMLEKLTLDDNPFDSLPDCVRSLSRLKYLSLGGCHMLKSVLRAPSTIEDLFVQRCYSLGKITFIPELSAPRLVYHRDSESLTEIQGIFKREAIAKVDEEILCSLGWINLEYVKNHKLRMWHDFPEYRARILPVQMLYEFGIFSTFFKGEELPNWLTHRNKGSSISFIMQLSPDNCMIQGLNVCFVYTLRNLRGTGRVDGPSITIKNLTKNCTWLYNPGMYAIRNANEEVVLWLSHWMFGNNEFEDGDEVSVNIGCGVLRNEHVNIVPDGAYARECGISVVYGDGDHREEDPLAYYKSWYLFIDRDVSSFQESGYLQYNYFGYLRVDTMLPMMPMKEV